MNCQLFISRMDDLIDSILPPDDCQLMEEHLRTCRNCRTEMKQLQSLLALSADLSEKPQRDLWPGIEAGINAPGVHQIAFIEQESGSALPSRTFRLTWRLTAVAILGAMMLLGAAYFRNRSSIPASNTAKEITKAARGNQKVNRVQDRQGPIPDPDLHSSESRESLPVVPPGNYSEACQCDPSPKILNLINKGFDVDENLPGQRAREVVSEQLYNLAGENSDDFFLHKTSIEKDTHFSMPAASATLTRRYLSKLVQRPGDPVWTYLYASSLYGKDTPEMIRIMQQLVADHPEFPWPNLMLAKAYAFFDYKDERKAKSYLQTFMKLCPESPEPLLLTGLGGNANLFGETAPRMRSNLAARSDVLSLLLYQNLWNLETERSATGEDLSPVRQRIREDLKRLEGFESSPGPREQLAQVIRTGYRQIDDVNKFATLFDQDTSWSGRWGAVMLRIQEWTNANPLPSAEAPAEKQIAYWKDRLRMSEAWIAKMPENPSLWMIKLEALAKLGNHPQSEFLDVASRVVALERNGAETPELVSHLSWKSNLLKLASLCADHGLLLDQVPALIREGYATAERRNRENFTDLMGDPQQASVMSLFNVWLEANDAWHSLARACLRAGKPDEAGAALNSIEPRIREFKALLAQARSNPRTDDNSIIEMQHKSMADQLAKLEEQYATARANVRRAARK
jgi:hypothetical protein